MPSVNTPVSYPGPFAAGLGLEPPNGTIYPSTSTSAGTINTREMSNPKSRGVRLYVTASVVAAGGTLDVKVQVKDPSSGTFVDLPGAAFAQVTATGTYVFTIGDTTDVPGVQMNGELGVSWRVVHVVAIAAITYSIGGEYLE